MNTARLIEIIDELRDVLKQQNMNLSDEVLFKEACSFLRGEYASQSKSSVNTSKAGVNSPVPPTQKQINFLRKSGWTGELPDTKEEARQIIESYIKNLKEENI